MNIWVFAQVTNGAPTSGTLELLSKAREVGTVTAFVGGDAAGAEAALGDFIAEPRRARPPCPEAIECDVVAGEIRVVGIECDDCRRFGGFNAAFLSHFAGDRERRCLAAFDAATR